METPPSLPIEPEKQYAPRNDKLFRLVAGVLVGVTVSLLSIYVAWKEDRQHPFAGDPQWMTVHRLRVLDDVIAEFQQKSNTIPRSLDQIKAGKSIEAFGGLADSLFKDGWGRPFLYSSDGTNYLITSYGQDGKPGGRGLDYDITSKNAGKLWWNPTPPESYPSISEFLFEMQTGGIIQTCIVCGVLAGALTYLMVRKPNFNTYDLLALGVQLLATTIGAFIIANFIAALHVPSGH